MPQLDKMTFAPILFWTALLYVGGFLLLNSTALCTFLNTMRLAYKRTTLNFLKSAVTRRFITVALLFPWIAL